MVAKLRKDLIRLVGEEDASALISSVSSERELLASLGLVVGVWKVHRGEWTREEFLERYGHRGPYEDRSLSPYVVEGTEWLDELLDSYASSAVDVDALLAKQRAEFETDLASNVVTKYRTTMIDQALKVVDENRQLPPEQQFVWTIPGWPMKKITEDWPGQSPERKQRVLQAFKDGRFVVHALPFTTHTELLEAEDLARGLRFSSELSRESGQPLPRDAKMTDVPSHSWILPTLLRHAGVDFLHLGCNAASSSPHVPPLFWWEGPDGSRLLTMYTAESYGTGLVPPRDWPHKTWLISGTADFGTGDIELNVTLLSDVYFANASEVCPRCMNNRCSSGDNQGKACTVDATLVVAEGVGDKTYDLSEDCPPLGNPVATLDINFDPLTSGDTGDLSDGASPPCPRTGGPGINPRPNSCGNAGCGAKCTGSACVEEIPNPANPSEMVCLDNKGGISQQCCNGDDPGSERPCFPLENGGTLSRPSKWFSCIPQWSDQLIKRIKPNIPISGRLRAIIRGAFPRAQ